MMKEVAAEAPRKINIVVNWLEELKQRAPENSYLIFPLDQSGLMSKTGSSQVFRFQPHHCP